MYNQSYENNKKAIASNLGINMNNNYNGEMKSKDAGKIGGVIGGNMVRNLIYIAEKNLLEKHEDKLL